MKMKPSEYPVWRYHKDHDPKLIQSEEDHEKLDKDWHDNPTDACLKLEVYEGGGHQRIRRVPDSKPQEVKPGDEGGDQGHVATKPEEDLSQVSEERLREILSSHGFPEKKLARKSREQLLAMLAS